MLHAVVPPPLLRRGGIAPRRPRVLVAVLVGTARAPPAVRRGGRVDTGNFARRQLFECLEVLGDVRRRRGTGDHGAALGAGPR